MRICLIVLAALLFACTKSTTGMSSDASGDVLGDVMQDVKTDHPSHADIPCTCQGSSICCDGCHAQNVGTMCGYADVCRTTAYCDSNGSCYVGTYLSGPCDDHNALTTDDMCWEGHCVGTAMHLGVHTHNSRHLRTARVAGRSKGCGYGDQPA